MKIKSQDIMQENMPSERTTKRPSFQAGLIITSEARKFIKRELLFDFFSRRTREDQIKLYGQGLLNLDKTYFTFGKAIEQATKRIRGTIKLSLKNNPEAIDISYRDAHGTIYRCDGTQSKVSTLNPLDILPKIDKNNESTMLPTVKNILGNLADMLRHNGYKWDENNPFAVAYEKLDKLNA